MPCRIPKKIAMINDIAGYGRCSATESIPIISAMKVQVCPVPTSLFSNHTGFPVHFMHDCTPYLRDYLAKWKELGFRFDGIYCGFLGSAEQIGIVQEFLAGWPDVPFILDPVMGDHGKAYRTVTPEHCEGLKSLLSRAAIITPNITEACLLTDTPYRESGWKRDELCLLARQLHAMGPDKVVITGLRENEDYINFISERADHGGQPDPFRGPFLARHRGHLRLHHRSGRGERRVLRGIGGKGSFLCAHLHQRLHPAGHPGAGGRVL